MAYRTKKRIVEEQIPEIMERFRRQGQSLKEIAASLGMSNQTLSNTLRAHNVDTARGAGKLDAEARHDLVTRYEQGEAIKALGRAFHIRTTAVREVLEAAGTPLRDLDWRFTSEQRATMVQRYEAGDFMEDIARDFGCSTWVIKNEVARHGRQKRAVGGQYRRFSAAEEKMIVAMRAEGRSQREVAIALGGSQIAISRAIRTLGLEQPNPNDGRRRWKGGVCINQEGYRLVLEPPDSPFASMRNAMGYVPEHRLVMARHLGRPLLRSETVHHIDGDKGNNDISNLQLRLGRHGNGQVWVCCDCGSHNVRPEVLAD